MESYRCMDPAVATTHGFPYSSQLQQLPIATPWPGTTSYSQPPSYDCNYYYTQPFATAQLSAKLSPFHSIPLSGQVRTQSPAASPTVLSAGHVSAPTPPTVPTKVKSTSKCKAVRDPQFRAASNLEQFTLAALSRMFPGKHFEKVRPAWLRNPRTGRPCELDFFNEELKLAVEVQGMQHYVYPNSWHKSREDWEEQVFRDQLKQDVCKRAGIVLVHVPFTVLQKDVEDFIRQEIQRVILLTHDCSRSNSLMQLTRTI